MCTIREDIRLGSVYVGFVLLHERYMVNSCYSAHFSNTYLGFVLIVKVNRNPVFVSPFASVFFLIYRL